jgi:hypothetical protein
MTCPVKTTLGLSLNRVSTANTRLEVEPKSKLETNSPRVADTTQRYYLELIYVNTVFTVFTGFQLPTIFCEAELELCPGSVGNAFTEKPFDFLL